MSAQSVDPEAVISRLAQQIGHLSAELAMRDAANEALQRRVAELEEGASGDAGPSES